MQPVGNVDDSWPHVMRRCPSEACGFRFVAFQSQSQGSYYHHVALCGRHPQTCFEHSANCICRPAKISCHTVSLVYASESNNLNWNWNYFNSNWNNFKDNTKILNWICNYINWNWIIAIQIEIIANPTDKYPLVSVLDTDSHTLKHTNLLISLYSHADVGAWWGCHTRILRWQIAQGDWKDCGAKNWRHTICFHFNQNFVSLSWVSCNTNTSCEAFDILDAGKFWNPPGLKYGTTTNSSDRLQSMSVTTMKVRHTLACPIQVQSMHDVDAFLYTMQIHSSRLYSTSTGIFSPSHSFQGTSLMRYASRQFQSSSLMEGTCMNQTSRVGAC
jgi:hypothetical protein